MWIAGLRRCRSRSSTSTRSSTATSPGPTIDMDFMNLNQSAHGDREFGFIAARLRLERKVVVGPLERRRRPGADRRLDARRVRAGTTGRPAGSPASATTCARSPSPRATRSRPSGGSGSASTATASATSSTVVDDASDADVDALVAGYLDEYDVAAELRPGGDRAPSAARRRAHRARPAARSSRTAASRRSPTRSRTSTASSSCPAWRSQRLMADGYGFGAEGDWKTAALVRAMKVMSAGLDGRHVVHGGLHLPPRPGGTTWSSARTCSKSARPSPAAGRASRSIRLAIGGKEDPVRLVFDAHPGRRSPPASPTWAIASGWSRPSSTSCPPSSRCPKLPVARAVWRPRPDLADERRGVDPRRRLAPHEPRLQRDGGASARLRRDGRDRAPRHRRGHPTSTPSGTSCAGTTSTGTWQRVFEGAVRHLSGLRSRTALRLDGSA